MHTSRLALLAPIASIMIISAGAGVLTTLTTVHLHQMQVSHWLIGAISSGFYVGIMVGAYLTQRFIVRVGHIRAFSAFASLSACTVILQGLILAPAFWLFTRFMIGYCLAGFFVVIESWLLAYSSNHNRGTILSLYMVAYYSTQGLGQLLLNIPHDNVLLLYCVITFFASLSVLPVTMTRFHAPSPEHPTMLSIRSLLKKVPIGVVGTVCAGLMMGTIFTLMPLFLSKQSQDLQAISYIMMLTIMGGTLLQYPLGKLSDKFDRRKVIVAISAIALIVFILMIFVHDNAYQVAAWAFLMGGTVFTLYPISTSHTIDYLTPEDVISATGTLLFAYGVGCALGPMIAPLFTLGLGEFGFFYYLIAVTAVLIMLTVRRIIQKPSLTQEEKSGFVALPQTSPEISQLDPEAPEH